MWSSSIAIKALIENWTEASIWLEYCLDQVHAPMSLSAALMIACEEQYVNMAHYAYTDDTGDIRIQLELDQPSGILHITFEDDGAPFNPLQHPDPDITLGAEERNIGGLGIYMINKTADKFQYERVNGTTNRVHIIKRL